MMEIGLLSILLFGFLLGLKHALEPDHVIAVSTIASDSKNLWKSSMTGVFWGIGHTLTLFIIGFFLLIMKTSIPEVIAMSLEFLVGVMIVVLGISSILKLSNKRNEAFHRDQDSRESKKTYVKSMGIGFVHGLAGSAALAILVMSTMDTLLGGAFYILIFGLGTIAGMLLFTMVIGIPFAITKNNERISQTLVGVIGVISTIFGIYYMYNLGVVEGLFQLWI
jgi:ABC-type nickel/cobalt efflux system permease component RcnA